MENKFYPFDRIAHRNETQHLDISVVFPVFNEGDIVESVLRDWNQALIEMGLDYELIVINDGSLDGTGRVLDRLRREMAQLRVIHQLNTGHGQAIRRGYLMARGQFVLQCDLNGRYEPEDFSRLWEARENHKIVIAQRTHRLDSFSRRLFSKSLRKFTQVICGVDLQDPNVPFRLIRREQLLFFLNKLPQGWQSTNLALSIFVSKEFPSQISEVKIPFRKRALGKTSTSLYDLFNLGCEYLSELFRLRKLLKPKGTGFKLPKLNQPQTEAY
jgi:glycosyltransferase involved in cell wall biosynthesis